MAYHQLEQLSRLYDGYMRPFVIEGRRLLLLQEAGKLHLIENRCPHMDIPLETGALLPTEAIRCRAHGIEFDLNTGKASGPLADSLDCLTRFRLAYEGTTVGVEF